MDFNPIDDVVDAVNKKKRQLVKYVANKTRSGPSIASGQSNSQPKYYGRSKKRPYRRP